MLAHRVFYLTAMMTASVIARSVTSPTMTSSPSEDSHLLFYLTVEKELVPQTADLASRALRLLEIQVGPLPPFRFCLGNDSVTWCLEMQLKIFERVIRPEVNLGG